MYIKKFVSTFIFLAIGFMVISTVYAQGTLNSQYVNEAFNSKAAIMRLNLNTLLREHTVLSTSMLKAMYADEDTSQVQTLIDNNQNALATLVQSAYGANAENTFVQIWSSQMKEYRNYAAAKKNNNAAVMNTSRKNLQSVAVSMGDLFAINNIASSTVSSLMMDHINGTLLFIDAVASKNPTTEANLLKQGYDQAGKFADALTMGVILDRPNLFK